jgi:hypothetical protein
MNPARIATFCSSHVLLIARSAHRNISHLRRLARTGPGPMVELVDHRRQLGWLSSDARRPGLVFSGTTLIDLQGNVSGGERRAFAGGEKLA